MNSRTAPTHCGSTIKILAMVLALAAWAPTSSAEQETFQPSHVAKLRTVTPEHDPIETHRGFGYSLRGVVDEL